MNGPPREPAEHSPFFEAMRDQFLARPLPTGRVRRPRRGRLGGWRTAVALPLAGAGMALAGAAVAVVIALGAEGTVPSPAYGVTFNHHTITITWHEWRQIGELNTRLAELGMRIRVVAVVHGCVAPVHTVVYAHSGIPTHVAAGPARTIEVAPPRASGTQGGILTTWNDTLPGRTRIFTATRSGGWDGGVFTVVGHAPRCVGDAR